MNPELAKLRDFATSYTAAWCGQNALSVAAHYSPEGGLSVNGSSPAVGRRAIADLVQGFMTAFPDLQVLLDDVSLERDGVVYSWTLIATNTGPGGTGRPVRISGHEVWRIGEDGLIAESHGHYDSADYHRQLDRGAGGSSQKGLKCPREN
jgi:SnoaL-like polyketide cyclase